MRGKKVLVVGAGVSGLAAAMFASERGADVEVVDESSRVGGLLARFSVRGLDCDLGSHRLHREGLAQPAVASLMAAVGLDRSLDVRPRRGVLLLGGRRVAYPPSFFDLARGLGRAGVPFAASFLRRSSEGASWDEARMDAPDDASDVGFERFVRARVGDEAYRAFYRPYVEKVWGLEGGEISQTVAKARVSTTAPLQLVRSRASRMLRRLVSRAIGRAPRDEGEFVYPRAGMSSFVDALVASLLARGVRLGAQAPQLVDGRALAARSDVDLVLHAGRLRDLVPAHAASLQHRGVYVLHLVLPISRVGVAETYYTPEARWWFGRVAEVQNYAPALRREGETTLTVEIPEGRWGPSMRFDEGALRDELLDQLRACGIVPRGVHPIELVQRFSPDVYPLYRRGWVARWSEAMRDVAAMERVLPFGRQGLFLHCNIDACITMASDAVAHGAAGGDGRAWAAKARAMLGVRVRD